MERDELLQIISDQQQINLLLINSDPDVLAVLKPLIDDSKQVLVSDYEFFQTGGRLFLDEIGMQNPSSDRKVVKTDGSPADNLFEPFWFEEMGGLWWTPFEASADSSTAIGRFGARINRNRRHAHPTQRYTWDVAVETGDSDQVLFRGNASLLHEAKVAAEHHLCILRHIDHID